MVKTIAGKTHRIKDCVGVSQAMRSGRSVPSFGVCAAVILKPKPTFRTVLKGLPVVCTTRAVVSRGRSTALGDSVLRAATGGGPRLALAQRSSYYSKEFQYTSAVQKQPGDKAG